MQSKEDCDSSKMWRLRLQRRTTSQGLDVRVANGFQQKHLIPSFTLFFPKLEFSCNPKSSVKFLHSYNPSLVITNIY